MLFSVNIIKMEEIKGTYVMITTTFKDAYMWNIELTILNSSCSEVLQPSGIFILFIYLLLCFSEKNIMRLRLTVRTYG